MESKAAGFQRDGAGPLWCAIANTEHGRIPGKAQGDTCWYPYAGGEHTTKDFEIVPIGSKSKKIKCEPQGQQNDGGGDLWCAIAKTEWGKIPGKANANGECWFPYGGEEHTTTRFKYAITDWEDDSSSSSSDSDKEALAPGFQRDGAGHLWCAIANTEHGQIPGKAKGGTCWYPYGGEEHTTEDFVLVRVRKLNKAPRVAAHGHQTDGGGDLWCAVAKTEHGKIPGKANASGECWYSYDGKEHTTTKMKFAS